MTRSIAVKKPEPRDKVFPRESNVSIATAEGFILRTNSGKKSCEKAGMHEQRIVPIKTASFTDICRM
jgi:hypothetical protein